MPPPPRRNADLDASILGQRTGRLVLTGFDASGEAVEDALDAFSVRQVAVEELVDDHALLVEQEQAGERDPVERHLVGLDQIVEHAVGADDLGVDVGQHRELNARRRRVGRKCFGVVVADGVELDVLGLKLRK